MTFTDDDLKRLKEHALLPTRNMIALSHNQVLALIARLEAAEKLVECFENRWNAGNLWEAWRRVAGK